MALSITWQILLSSLLLIRDILGNVAYSGRSIKRRFSAMHQKVLKFFYTLIAQKRVGGNSLWREWFIPLNQGHKTGHEATCKDHNAKLNKRCHLLLLTQFGLLSYPREKGKSRWFQMLFCLDLILGFQYSRNFFFAPWLLCLGNVMF